jgi:alpha-glucosidase (family GH31 glycosyl hydrolase)
MKSLLVWVSLFAFASAHAETAGNYTSHEIENGRLIIHAGIPVLRIAPYTEDMLRVSIFPDGIQQDDASSVLVLTPQNVPWQLTDQDSLLRMTTSTLTLEIQKYPVRLRWIRNGEALLEDQDGVAWQGDRKSARFRMNAGEHFYGSGERATGLDRRGLSLDFYNAPRYCYGFGEANMNIAIPLFVSSRGYGIYFEDPYPGHADLGASVNDVFDYTAANGSFSYFMIGGGNYREVLKSYAELTGKPTLPPRWALGYMQSRYGYQSETEARNVVSAFRDRQIPLDALILDLYWYGTGQMGDFDWDRSHWPDPVGMIRDFDSSGVRTILISEPYFVLTSSNYGFANAVGYFARDSAGHTYTLPNFWFGPAALLDITNPDASEWLWGLYANLISQGVGGWWCDLGEPEMHPSGMVHTAGSADRVHNVYSLEWAKLLDRHYRQSYPQQRLFNLIRSGYAGMQHYGTYPWSGDVQRTFSGLQAQIPILLNMGMSGVPFCGSDIGGFSCGPTNPELYIRWMEFGAFSPLMRAHGTDIATEPVYMDSTTCSLVRDYINLRYSLLPYNYSLVWEASRSGTPMARPLFFDVNDDAAANMIDEYLWGDAFLVAPVVNEDAVMRSVYLPAGNWIDYWTEHAFSGPRTIMAEAPLNRLPLFVKAGSIIPTIPPRTTTKGYSSDTLIVHYYPDFAVTSVPYIMYNDNGETPDAYDAGHYETVTITPELGDIGAIMTFERDNHGYTGSPATRRMIVQLHRVQAAPSAVRFAGHLLPTVSSLSELEAADSAVFFSPVNHRLYVSFHWSDGTEALEIESLFLLDAPDRQPRDLAFRLEPAYPNPFNSTAVLRYAVPTERMVSVRVYDVLGREIATLVQEKVAAGEHRIVFDGSRFGSGIYFCRLSDGVQMQTQKLVLLK